MVNAPGRRERVLYMIGRALSQRRALAVLRMNLMTQPSALCSGQAANA